MADDEHSQITVGVTLGLQEPDPHDPPKALRVGGRLFIETEPGNRQLADGGALGVAWEQLRGLLDRQRIALTDEELIAMPLLLELSSELLAKLDH